MLIHARVDLYQILFYSKAFVHESNILVLSPRICNVRTIAKVLHDYCAIYAPPPHPPLLMPYTIQYWQWQSRVKANARATRKVGP